MTPEQIDPRQLMRTQFALSKWWLGVASLSRVSVVAIAAITIFYGGFAQLLVIASAVLSVLYVLSQWYADRLKSVAESLLRKLEMHDGLGWPISGREYADLLLSIPRSVKAKAASPIDGDYYASKQSQSSQRVLENLIESTWWTKHQANRMATYVGIFSVIVIGIAIMAMTTAMQSALALTTLSNISRVAIAVIVFMFSGGYIRLAFDYKNFADLADRVEDKAEHMLKSSTISDIQVIKLLHDYQIVRVKAPLLPDWLWKRMEAELNDLWKQHTKANVTDHSNT